MTSISDISRISDLLSVILNYVENVQILSTISNLSLVSLEMNILVARCLQNIRSVIISESSGNTGILSRLSGLDTLDVRLSSSLYKIIEARINTDNIKTLKIDDETLSDIQAKYDRMPDIIRFNNVQTLILYERSAVSMDGIQICDTSFAISHKSFPRIQNMILTGMMANNMDMMRYLTRLTLSDCILYHSSVIGCLSNSRIRYLCLDNVHTFDQFRSTDILHYISRDRITMDNLEHLVYKYCVTDIKIISDNLARICMEDISDTHVVSDIEVGHTGHLDLEYIRCDSIKVNVSHPINSVSITGCSDVILAICSVNKFISNIDISIDRSAGICIRDKSKIRHIRSISLSDAYDCQFMYDYHLSNLLSSGYYDILSLYTNLVCDDDDFIDEDDLKLITGDDDIKIRFDDLKLITGDDDDFIDEDDLKLITGGDDIKIRFDDDDFIDEDDLKLITGDDDIKIRLDDDIKIRFDD